MQSGRRLTVFRRNVLPLSLGSKCKPSKQIKQASKQNLVPADCFRVFYFDPRRVIVHSSETSVTSARLHVISQTIVAYPLKRHYPYNFQCGLPKHKISPKSVKWERRWQISSMIALLCVHFMGSKEIAPTADTQHELLMLQVLQFILQSSQFTYNHFNNAVSHVSSSDSVGW
jgi:hypothetical protein